MMADLHTLEIYSQKPEEQRRGFRFILLMSLCGLASGVVTANIAFGYLTGGTFGVALASSLFLSGIVTKIWKLISLVAITTAAFCISWLFAVFVEMSLPWKHLSMGTAPSSSPVSLFAGGVTGGFIILSGSLLVTNFQIMTLRTIRSKAFLWSIFSGVLAPIAWALGPSLGTLVVPYRQPYAIAEFSNQCALYVVWQTGVAFALGMILRNMREIREKSPVDELKLT
jgi:hypothetical protein